MYTKEFDLQCAKYIKDFIGARICAIYKYDILSEEMVLSASTSSEKQIDFDKEAEVFNIDSYLKKTIENWRIPFHLEEGVIDHVYERNEPMYFVTGTNSILNSMLLAPMIKKDGTCLGMILLIGKDMIEMTISKTYWEQDKKYIKFMADIFSFVEESDADSLVFLLRLSHELRKPITEMVNKNDFLLCTAKRNRDIISKKELIDGLSDNMYTCIMLKQIIEDIETFYSMRNGQVSYDFKDENVKECLFDVIRLFEQGRGAFSDKGLSFTTYLSQMPQKMYVDKERINQVFSNIIKNAIQYSDNFSTIAVSYNYNKQDNCHEIDFQNYGIGIAPNEEKIIFDLWERGEAVKKKFPNGTGMGLSIVKEIMETHGGRCYVKQLNNPTIFTVCIPNK